MPERFKMVYHARRYISALLYFYLYISEVLFTNQVNLRFVPPLREVGVTNTHHPEVIGKLVVEFLLVIIERSCIALTGDSLQSQCFWGVSRFGLG